MSTKTGRYLAGAGLVLAAFALAILGCGGTESETAATDPADAAAAGASTGDGSGLPHTPPAPPTLDELRAVLDLTAEQASAVETALASWREAAAAHPGGRRPGRGRPDEEGPPRLEGPCVADRMPPPLEFLARSADILDSQQFAALTGFLTERRRAHRQAIMEHEGSSPGGRGGPGSPMARHFEQLAAGLGLSDAEREAVREAFAASRSAIAALHIEASGSTLSPEEIRDRARAIRLALEERLRTALGGQRFETLRDRMRERHIARAARWLEDADRAIECHAGLLDRLLALEDEQRTQVESALRGFLPRWQALLERARTEHLPPEDVIYEGHRLAEEMRASVRTALTPAQAERFDALRDLLPGHGPGAGPGGRMP